MKKRLIAFRTTKQILKDMENLIQFGRYRDKTDVFHSAIRLLLKNEGVISTNNNNRNKVKR